MSTVRPALPAVDEVRQANSLFLHFLRARPGLAGGYFGLSVRVTDLLGQATPEQVDRAADFPRALFRLRLPEPLPVAQPNPLRIASDDGRHVLQAALFQSAWNICRISGYAARMLLRLDDDEVDHFRHAEMKDILQMALSENVLRAAFDELDWIWKQLLTETRPECRQRLLLIGLQPGPSLGMPAVHA